MFRFQVLHHLTLKRNTSKYALQMYESQRDKLALYDHMCPLRSNDVLFRNEKESLWEYMESEEIAFNPH